MLRRASSCSHSGGSRVSPTVPRQRTFVEPTFPVTAHTWASTPPSRAAGATGFSSSSNAPSSAAVQASPSFSTSGPDGSTFEPSPSNSRVAPERAVP